MKNQNNKVTAVLFVVALALAPMVQAAQQPGGALRGFGMRLHHGQPPVQRRGVRLSTSQLRTALVRAATARV